MVIGGFAIFCYLLAGVWLAYHQPKWDSRTVRFLTWWMMFWKPKGKSPGHGGIPVWKNGKLTWKFPEYDKVEESRRQPTPS